MRQFAKLIAIPKQLTISILGLFLVFTQPVFAGVDKGIDVSKVQTMLTELCFKPGPVDGAWGKRTERAAAEFFDKHFDGYDGQFTASEFAKLNQFNTGNLRDLSFGVKTLKRCEVPKPQWINLDLRNPPSDVIDYGWEIPEFPRKKPDNKTLQYYLARHLGWYKNMPHYKSGKSSNVRKIHFDATKSNLVNSELNKTALLSYLLYENDRVSVDAMSPKDRFGNQFNNATPLIANSIGKSFTAYLLGHAICQGYIESPFQTLSDWQILEDTLYSDIQLIELLNMRAGDQMYTNMNGLVEIDFNKNDFFLKSPNNRSIKSMAQNELKDSKKSRAYWNYSTLPPKLVINYIDHKVPQGFSKLFYQILNDHIGTEYPVIIDYSTGYRSELLELGKGDGRINLNLYMSRYDYLRFAMTILEDWHSDTCIGNYLKTIYNERKSKGNFKPRDQYGRIGTPRGYGGFMHADWVGFKGRNIISMDGYGGQVIAIDLDLKRVVVINAIHSDYDWKKIVRQVLKDG